MPGDQLRTFVERNQKKEMEGNASFFLVYVGTRLTFGL